MSHAQQTEYTFRPGHFPHTSAYLWPTVLAELGKVSDRRVFEVGCGDGALGAELTRRGWSVTGVDPSKSGVEAANRLEAGEYHVGSTDDDLGSRFGTFPAVVSLEVVEHVFLPRIYAKAVFDLLEPGGVAVISTPYHGYWKNLALALTGKMDSHFTALWDYGHVKFWSVKTLTELLTETGFTDVRFHRVGRVPAFAKSMIAVARKPL